MRIAIVEPEPAAADLLIFAAQRCGHQPVCVATVERLFERLPFEPSVAVLSARDTDAAFIDGVTRLKARYPRLGVFVVTEERSPHRPIAAIRAGAQDVIPSPYNPFEVILKAEAWLEAHPRDASSPAGVRIGDLEVDLDTHVALKNGHALTLTKLERRLLYCLGQHYPNLASTERLLTFGWEGQDEPDNAILKTHMSHIRRKLRDAGGQGFEIVAHQGVGYALRSAQEERIAS